jgi:hypothetical protein
MKEYFDRQRMFGTISVLTGTGLDDEEAYNLQRISINIEQLFDTFENTLHVDKTYMGDNRHMQGGMLINFMAMLKYYKLYAKLVSKNLLRKYSQHGDNTPVWN